MALFPIHALRQRLAGIQSKLQTIHNRSEAEGRQLTTQEQADWDSLIADRKIAASQLAEVEKAMELERSGAGAVQIQHSGVPWQQHPPGQQVSDHSANGFKARSAKFQDVFPNATLSNDGFNSFNEFLSAWHSAPKQFDPRLRMSQGENTPALGGFAVPTEFAAMLMNAALENEIVRPRAQVWEMTSQTRKIPAWDGFDHSAGLYGGFTSQWVSEGAAITPADAKMRLMQLTANKLALLGSASNDVPGGFGSVYGAAMVAATSWFLDYHFLRGTGAGQPLGVLNDPALIVQAKDSADSTTAMSFKDIVSMFSRLHPASIANAVWVASSTTIPALMSLSNANAPLVPLVTQQSDGKLYMLARQILFTEKLPTLGNQGDILLVDFSQYAIGMRQGTALEQSQQAGITTDQTWFRVITRVDGQSAWVKEVNTTKSDNS
jgi:HK97 family phage major capsid protein